MAIDKVTGKRQKVVKTEIEKKEEKRKKALPKFDTKYEEELIKQLFEEDQKKQDIDNFENMIPEYSGPFVHHERPGEEWDVPITEEIQYFDPELSYELTGYRPINMTKGLDFDPTPFCEMANIYNSTGRYTNFPEWTKPWHDLW